MISKRKVIKKYNQLLKDVETHDFYKMDLTNKVNCYVCDTCRHITKVKVVDAGVTPMFFDCEKCKEQARSTFFNDTAPNQEPTIEWYRPSLREVLKMRNNPDMLNHILKGGLDYRVINVR